MTESPEQGNTAFEDFDNFYKNCVALFWRLSHGRTSRMPQSRVHHRDFLRFTGDSLAGKCFSREKDLEYFSKIWNFMLFAAQVGNLFVGGRSSREGYIEIFAAQFATLS